MQEQIQRKHECAPSKLKAKNTFLHLDAHDEDDFPTTWKRQQSEPTFASQRQLSSTLAEGVAWQHFSCGAVRTRVRLSEQVCSTSGLSTPSTGCEDDDVDSQLFDGYDQVEEVLAALSHVDDGFVRQASLRVDKGFFRQCSLFVEPETEPPGFARQVTEYSWPTWDVALSSVSQSTSCDSLPPPGAFLEPAATLVPASWPTWDVALSPVSQATTCDSLPPPSAFLEPAASLVPAWSNVWPVEANAWTCSPAISGHIGSSISGEHLSFDLMITPPSPPTHDSNKRREAISLIGIGQAVQYKLRLDRRAQLRQTQDKQTQMAGAANMNASEPKVMHAEMRAQKFCPCCGGGVLPHFNFCKQCGAQIAATR